MALLAAKLSKSAFLFGTDTTTVCAARRRAWKTAFKKNFLAPAIPALRSSARPFFRLRDVMLSLGILVTAHAHALFRR